MSDTLVIPLPFAQHMADLHGAKGTEWVNRLPTLIQTCARDWELFVHAPFPNLSYNYVAPATLRDGTEAVLKIGFPDRELATEMEALRLAEGHGLARLLAADVLRGAMLLERLTPGITLLEVEDDKEATTIAVVVMRDLWRPAPVPSSFPTVGDWERGFGRLRTRFNGGTGPLPSNLFAVAERLYSDLLASSAPPVLLHGDLHHENILSAQREPWLAIDPKGVLGEPAYETGALLRNPMPRLLEQLDPGRVLARRVDQLAEQLGFDRKRILGWGVAQAVLSACWSIEDEGYGWEPAIRCAELLAQLLR